MRNGIRALSVLLLMVLLGTCTNYYHELIPPEDNFILSFEVDGQLGAAIITDNTVLAYVEKGTNLHSLIPRVSVSNKATLLPVTLDYVMAMFPSMDLIKTMMQINTTADITSFLMQKIKENKDFIIPALNIPIDFTGPVTMLVVGGQGDVRQYTIELIIDTGEPRLLNFGFSKYDNEELVIDARGIINEANRTVTVNALYPVEMNYLSYKLIPSFQIQGSLLEIDDISVVSGSTEVQFASAFGNQDKIIRVTRDGEIKDYTLTITFAEDPDTIRSITDFRFTKANNPDIAANAVASIINTDNTGTISVQVFYSGAKPLTLTPRFVSPGVVSVGGITQTSGANSHDFSSPLEYRIVSKNGLYTRIYTVKTEFISVTDGAPRITSFRFSAALNTELVQDAVGEIIDGLILIDVRYSDSFPPISLIPEFSAEGLVTVYGSVQVSGASPQDFYRQIKYTVINPLNPLFARDYWIQCRMIKDTSSDAAITLFGFYPEDNAGLADEVIGKIDQINGKITVYAPVGSGVTKKTMYPRFTAAGLVKVEETTQVSGVSGRMFDAPVTYTAVSANGANSRSYVLTVRELQSTIYVNCNAFGYGDGTSWENSFRTIRAACEAAALFPEDTPKEIWIAKGTYKPGATEDGFPLTANTSYIGGFAGGETAKSQRNVTANEVIISGDFGGGLYTKRLFSSAGTLNGNLSFDALKFTSASGSASGGGIYAVLSSQGVLSVTNCSFDNVRVSDSGGAVYVRGGGVIISNVAFNTCNNAVYVQGTTANINEVKFSMCTGSDAVQLNCLGETGITKVTIEDSSAINLSGNGGKTLETVSIKRGGGVSIQNSFGNLRINNSDLTDISGNGVWFNNFNGNMEINSINLHNVTGYGIYGGNSSPNRIQLSGITANAIGVSQAVSLSLTQGAIILGNSNITNKGVYLKTGMSSLIDVSNINITDVTSGNAITIGSGNNVTIDNVNINDIAGNAINVNGVNNTVIGNVKIKNVSNNDTIVVSSGNNATISNVDINGVTTGDGLYMNLSGNIEISRLSLNNIGGYGIYCSGSPNKVQLSCITGNDIGYNPVYLSLLKGAIILESSNFTNNSRGIYLVTSTSNSVDIINTNITNVKSGDALNVNGGNNAAISNVDINGVTTGDGLYMNLSGNAEISRLSLNNIGGYGIRCFGSSNKVQFSNITGNNISRHAVYLSLARGAIIIEDSNLTNNGGIYLFTNVSSSVNVRNTNITNITTDAEDYYKNAALYINNVNNITIDRVNIDSVNNIGIAAGDYTDVDNSILIANSVIKNCKNMGIDIISVKEAEISNTTIENIEARNYGGIKNSGGRSLKISGCSIKNAIGSVEGAGICSPNGILNINDTTMELCISEDYGAIYNYDSTRTSTITNSRFINCTARGRNKILDFQYFNVIRNCEFIHDVNLPDVGVSTYDTGKSLFGYGGGNFEDCTFTNLKGNMPSGQNYLFSPWQTYPSGGIMRNEGSNLILKNCTFNLAPGSAGIMALYGGVLLMDNVTINDNGGQKPLIWLYNSPNGSSTPGTFQFKPNNTYNGNLLNTQAAITTLVTHGVITLTNGATPVLVP
jgi:hypothetical protein